MNDQERPKEDNEGENTPKAPLPPTPKGNSFSELGEISEDSSLDPEGTSTKEDTLLP